MTFCGCPGQLGGVGADPLGAEGCLLWRTDTQLLGSAERACPSLLYLACEVAEFYHRKCALRLTELPGVWVVIWLEMAADGSLLVFFKPAQGAAPA